MKVGSRAEPIIVLMDRGARAQGVGQLREENTCSIGASSSNDAPPTPLDAARAHLQYWRDELAAAAANAQPGRVDAKRIQQCERFIKHCEIVVVALEQADRAPK
jgi:hypothetical protein